MLLNQIAHFNDLSPELRKEVEERILSFGASVRYKFDISNKNPDPTKHDGEYIWPNQYTLDPAVFNIVDPYEKRPDKSKSKRIAIVTGVDAEKGVPNKFDKIKIRRPKKGILTLQLDNDEDYAKAFYLELHPKLNGGKFADKTKRQNVVRIDDAKAATEKRTERTEKLKALNVAQGLSDAEVVQFADAMLWDSTDTTKGKGVLRNKIEELAETSPTMFNDLVAGKNIEYQAVVKQALDKQLIAFDPTEYKFTWSANQMPITMLSPVDGKNHVEIMAEWLQIGGERAEEAYKKIKSLIK